MTHFPKGLDYELKDLLPHILMQILKVCKVFGKSIWVEKNFFKKSLS